MNLKSGVPIAASFRPFVEKVKNLTDQFHFIENRASCSLCSMAS